MSRMLKEASSDALGATKRIASDPIAGIAASFAALGAQRAQAAGFAFGLAFAILTALASTLAAAKLGADSALKLALSVFLVSLVPFVALTLTSAGARRILGGAGTWNADVFVAGIALQPIGIFFVLAAILGGANWQVIAVLSFVAWTYMLCILFSGSTRLVGIPERFAPPAISVMLLAAIWSTKIAANSFFDPSSPIGRLFN
ncbi:MAG TPA: hypothetical protein VGQ76_12600 [Thermoanaerobaculia bacterium]|nr:hypothetical protein [Thermoanaerobaculia bacterium]